MTDKKPQPKALSVTPDLVLNKDDKIDDGYSHNDLMNKEDDSSPYKYRRGAWNKADKAVLKEKVLEGTPWDELEILFNRPAKTIKLFAERYEYEGDLVENYVEGASGLRRKLKKRDYYAQVENTLTEEEVCLFESQWINLMLQFREDILYVEELQLKAYLTLEILTGRSLSERLRQSEEIDRLQAEVDKEYERDEDSRDVALLGSLDQQLSYAKNSIKSYTVEHKTLLEKSQQILKDLKATRDQRVKRIEDSKSSWQGLIRSLEDEKERAKIGRDAELMRMAKDKAAGELAEYHQYSDGELAQPLLNCDTVKDEDD